jgi:hypothetical protein
MKRLQFREEIRVSSELGKHGVDDESKGEEFEVHEGRCGFQALD